ncbi:hypothetical protein [Ahniella affigens]|nr:hypothetical protein [Ahniella affigens]
MRTIFGALCAIGSLSIATSVQAQVFAGDRGAGCVSIPAGGGNHVVTITGAVPVGSALMLAAGTSKNATMASPTQVSDNRGNVYTGTMSRIHLDNFDLRAFTFVAPITQALQTGDQVTLHYSAADIAGETSCASASRFDGVDVSTPVMPILTVGEQTTNATSHSASTGTTTTANLLIYESVVISGSHGGIGVNPGNPMSVACNGANNFCVVPAYRIVSSVGNYAITAITTNPVKATMAMSAYGASPLVFRDGFE